MLIAIAWSLLLMPTSPWRRFCLNISVGPQFLKESTLNRADRSAVRKAHSQRKLDTRNKMDTH